MNTLGLAWRIRLCLALFASFGLFAWQEPARAAAPQVDPAVEAMVRKGAGCWKRGQYVYQREEHCGRTYLADFDKRHPLGKRMAALGTLSVLANDRDPRVFEAVMWLLEQRYFPTDTPIPHVYAEADGARAGVSLAVAKRFIDAAARIPANHDWNGLFPTAVHVAVLAGAEDALRAKVAGMQYHRKREELSKRLLVFGLEKHLATIRAEVRNGLKAADQSDDQVHALVLLAALERLPELSKAHRATICPWMKQLARYPNEFAVAAAGAALLRCGGDYPNAFRKAVAKRHVKESGNGTVVWVLERACSEKKYAARHCEPSLRVLKRLALDPMSSPAARTDAANVFLVYAPLPQANALAAKLEGSLLPEEFEELKAELEYRKRKEE